MLLISFFKISFSMLFAFVSIVSKVAKGPLAGQLLFVEASRSKGSGKLTVTGQLGEVMLESVRTAMPL